MIMIMSSMTMAMNSMRSNIVMIYKHDDEHHNDLFTIGIEHRDDFKDASLSQCVRFDAVTSEEIQHTLGSKSRRSSSSSTILVVMIICKQTDRET